VNEMVSTGKARATGSPKPDQAQKANPSLAASTAARRTAVMIVAMHRSGTSALSRALNLLGCDMPPRLIGADQWNSAGYWESKPIKDLNEEMLVSGGGEWSEWQEFNPGWFRSSAVQRFRDRAIELVGSEFGDSPLFVFKDPRLSILMPFWRSVLEELGIEPVAIHPLRNPVEVARSLERRNNFLISKGVLLWLRYTLDGERGTRGLRRLFTSYDELLEDPVGLIQRTQDSLDVYWPRNSAKARREITQFLSNDMRHHRDGARVLRSLSYATDWVVKTYETLNGFVTDGEDEVGRAVLDAVREEFIAAGHAFGSIARDNEERHARIAQLQQEREKAGARQSELESATAAAQAELEALRSGQAALEASLSDAQGRLATLETGKATLDQQLADARKERDELRERARDMEQAAATSSKQLDELKAAQADVEARAVQAQERADAIQRAKEALEGRHLATQKERDALREMRGKLESDVASALAAVKSAQERADAAERDAAAQRETSAQELADALLKLAEAEAAASDHQVKATQTEALAKQWEERSRDLSDQLTQERAAHEAELTRLQDDLAQTESALRQRQLESEQAAEALLNAKRDLHEQRETDTKARDALEHKLAEAQDQVRELDRARAAAEEALKARFHEIATLTEQFALREMELAQARQSLVRANQLLEERDAQLRALSDKSQTELSHLRGTLEKAERDKEALAQSLRERNEETADLQTAVNKREMELAQVRQNLQHVQQLNAQMEGALSDRDVEVERLRRVVVDHERASASAQEALQELTQELAKNKADADRTMQEHDARYHQLLKDREERSRLLNDVQDRARLQSEELSRVRASLEEQGAQFEKSRKDYDAAMKAVQTDVMDLTRKRDIFKASALANQNSMVELYHRLQASLETMLAQAVLPFPKLTRKKTEQQQRRLIVDHAGFDADWYVTAYPDVAVSSLDPALHFIRHGLAEGRSPNAEMAALREMATSSVKG
jgi:hypothetical protein